MKTVSFATASLIAMIVSANAAPIEYKKGNFTARFSGYGNVGVIEPEFRLKDARLVGDWSARGQITYNVNDENKLGLVYSLNQQTIDDGDAINDLFALWQIRGHGRLEIGLTDSVAEKLL